MDKAPQNVPKKRKKIVPVHFLAKEIERIRIEKGISKKDMCQFSRSSVVRYNKFLLGEGGFGMAKIAELFDRLRFDGYEYVIVDKKEYEALREIVDKASKINIK